MRTNIVVSFLRYFLIFPNEKAKSQVIINIHLSVIFRD